MRVPFIAHEFSFSFVRWQLCNFFFQMLHCVTLMAALGWPLTWVFILNYITASERWAYLSVTWCTWSSMSSTVCTVYISIWLCEISKYWRCCPWEGSRQKKNMWQPVAGWARHRLIVWGVFPAGGFCFSYMVTNEDMFLGDRRRASLSWWCLTEESQAALWDFNHI